MTFATLGRVGASALFASALALPATAQATFDLRTQATLSGSTYTVEVQMRMSTPTQAGLGNLVFTYNENSLRPPSNTASGPLVASTDYTPLALSSAFDSDYQPLTVTRNVRAGNDEYSINIELNVDNAGTVIGTDWVSIVSIPFTVTGGVAERGEDAPASAAAFPADIAWDPANTTTFLFNGADNATQLVNGVFTGDNSALPVELTRFGGALDGRNVRLEWATASETNNAGFAVEQATGEGEFREVHFLPGRGTTTEASSYTYVVPNVSVGTHRFRLRQMDTDGAANYSSVVEVAVEAAREFRMAAPAPNPVRTQSFLAFTVENDGPATMALYDMLGREVSRMFDGMAVAGQEQRGTVDASDLAPGTYVVRLTQGTKSTTQMLRVAR